MPEIGTSGSMSGDGKRSVAEWPKLSRPSSTLPSLPSSMSAPMSAMGGKADNIVAHSGTRSNRAGRSPRARSRRGSCRPSDSWERPRLKPRANGTPLFASGCPRSARSMVAISQSNIVGRGVATSVFLISPPEFVRLKVDVIVTYGTAPVLAAKEATSTIPIVFAATTDPVGIGLVASLARPGRNITGMANQAPDIADKRIELVVPRLRRLAIMVNAQRGRRRDRDARCSNRRTPA
jgi:hypothetical protein